jgi:rhodanese-related sulfurtransferase
VNPRAIGLIAMIAVLSCGVGFGQEEDISSPKLRIAWDEFKPLYDAKKAAVVDVRDEASFQAGHIPHARSVPLDDIEKRASELKKLKTPIVTYCA